MGVFDVDLTGMSKVDLAIERIRNFCRGKKTLVAFSGGKDSQCCYHLAKEAGIDFSAQYSITRFEPPELLEFIRTNYKDVTFRRAYKMSLVEQIRRSGLPNRWFRWCCHAKHVKTKGFDIAIIGVRWQESARRRARWDMFGYKADKSAYVCPIVDWTEADVWEYLNSRNIPHCKLYDEGLKRIGCVCCPLAPNKMRSDSIRWPKIAHALFVGHRLNWQKLSDRGFMSVKGKKHPMGDFTPEESFEFWLDNGRLNMNRQETNPGEAPCLFAGTGFSESDGNFDGDL